MRDVKNCCAKRACKGRSKCQRSYIAHMASIRISHVSDDLRARIKAFLRKRDQKRALVINVDKEAQTIVEDEYFEDCELETVAEALPDAQPRFVSEF